MKMLKKMTKPCKGISLCPKKGEGGSKRSITAALIPLILTIGLWPMVGVFKAYVWKDEVYPYPLTVCLLVQGVIFIIGSLWYTKQAFKRGFKCCGKAKKSKKNKEGKVKKDPLTPYICLMRYFHWGFFPGMFLTIFVYAAVVAEPLCRNNPNFCTLLFRAPLFIVVLTFLAFNMSERRGGRIDWVVALLLWLGVLMLMWNSSKGFTISFTEDIQIAICGALALLCFGGYCLMLRKASQDSGVMKVLYVQSTYAFWFTLILAVAFEGSDPWNAAYRQHGQVISANGTLIWKLIVLVIILVVWEWAIVSAANYTETIIIALALEFALFLGDFGVHGYVANGYNFDVASIIGMLLVGLPALWLLKRLITMNCPGSCGGYCDWGAGDEKSTLLVDHALPGEEELLDLEEGKTKPSGVSKYGPTYGATTETNVHLAQPTYNSKSQKHRLVESDSEDTTLDDSGSGTDKKKSKKSSKKSGRRSRSNSTSRK